jgi:hypothetical protein
MRLSIVERLRDHLIATHSSIPYKPVSEREVQAAEEQLGFRIPETLRLTYTTIGNGGFGPAGGGTIIGLCKGGYVSDLGFLVDAYRAMHQSAEVMEIEWPEGMLPFCEWGCSMQSCVDCTDPRSLIFLSHQLDWEPQRYDIDQFVELWISGANIVEADTEPSASIEFTNPFSGKKDTMHPRKPRKRS